MSSEKNEHFKVYEQTLEGGFRSLRFSPALEIEFRQDYLALIRGRVVSCLIAVIVLMAWVMVTREPKPAGSAIDPIAAQLLTWGMRPLSLILMVIALVPLLYRRLWVTAAPLLLGGMAIIGSYSAAQKVASGNTDVFIAMVCGYLGMYMLAGLMFWQVLAVGTITTVAYLFFLQAAGAPAEAIGFEAFIICAMTGLAIIFIYNLEHTLRRSFLQQHALEHLSNVDALTGLKNRRVFEESLEMLWKQGMRDKQPIGMILIDVDHFKNYNDLYGHAAGDRCLKTIGGLLRGAVKRPLDMAARLGGEEFALLCYGSTRKHVSALAESVRRAVVDANIPHAASSAAEQVTVSVGAVFVQPGIGRSSQSLYQFADEALYAAKSNGRNRVEVLDDGYSNIVTGAFKVN